MKSSIRIGINGFGRIGRGFLRQLLLRKDTAIEVVAINDLGSPKALAHLFEFDSIHGRFPGRVSYTDSSLVIDDITIPLINEKNIEALKWRGFNPDLVLESTGKFKTEAAAMRHVANGAPRVLVSAVAQGENVKTIVLGANETLLDGSEKVISNASCTTNCAAPLIDVLDRNFGIESAYITTVHSYTTDQTLHDRPHEDLRRARSAALSIIPTTTGAAKAITKIFPHLEGLLGGAGIRVPVPNGSLTDITCIVREQSDVKRVNQAFKEASAGNRWGHYLEYTDKPLVSIDVVGNAHSCVFDSELTSVIGNMVKVVGWYDNEIGYSNRLIDLIVYWSRLWD